MKTRIIPHENGNFIVSSEEEPINHVWPIEYFERTSKHIYIKLARLHAKPETINNPFFHLYLEKRAHEDWLKTLVEMRALRLPYNFLKLLTSNRKKEQISLWKGQSLSTSQFKSLLLLAGEGFGYRYSKFRVEFHPAWAYEYKIPRIFHLRDNGQMDIIGETNMSNGQLRQLLEQRTVRISHFLDNGHRWHCLYTTYRSLNGQESYGKGTPHMHYLSNFWQWERQMVVNGLRSRSHKFASSIHIPYVRRG